MAAPGVYGPLGPVFKYSKQEATGKGWNNSDTNVTNKSYLAWFVLSYIEMSGVQGSVCFLVLLDPFGLTLGMFIIVL